MSFLSAIWFLLGFSRLCASQSCSSACDHHVNYCYIASTSGMNSAAAQSFCGTVGGQLPFFGSASDLSDYNNYVNVKLSGASTWLGYWNYNAHSPTSPGTWADTNGAGQPAPFTSWNSGEPNDSGGNEKCVQTLDANLWNDVDCSRSFNVVCMCECPTIPPIANGNIVNPTVPTRINAVTTFSCNAGYTRVGPSSINCILVGGHMAWSLSPPTCLRMQCTDWFNTATGTPDPGPYLSGVNYNFACSTNYVTPSGLATSKTYNCQLASGTWQQASFTPCIATCPLISTITNGLVTGGTNPAVVNGRTMAGGIATFSCIAGYALVGSASLTCQTSGTWSNAQPICQRMQCLNWYSTATGSPDPAPYYAGTNYNFYCSATYVTSTGLSTSDTYNCLLASGTWSQPSFTPCIATCPVLNNITYGNLTGGENSAVINGRTMAGGVAQFTCNPGYDLLGQQNVTCLPYGNWSDPQPVCQNNCTMTPWGVWSSCSANCGTGVNRRTRNVTTSQTYNGVCWNLFETKSCDAGSCWNVLLADVLMAFSCTFLLGSIAVTFVLNLVWRVWHLERLIHACEEVTLFIAHLFILFFRGATYFPLLCTITATCIQYFMVSCFTFFALESFQMYSYVTSCLGRGNLLPPILNLLIGFGLPFIITVPTALLHYDVYPSYFTCWLNWGNLVSMTSTIPIILGTWIAVIGVESAGMGEYDSVINRNKTKYVAGKFSQRGLILVAPSCLVHWFMGMYATYYQNVAIFFGVAVAFVTLGVLIFIHHGLCHRVIAIWAIKFWFRISRKKGPLPLWTTDEPEEPMKLSKWIRWFYLRKKPIVESPPVEEIVEIVQPEKPIPKALPPRITYERRPLGPEVWLTHEELFGETLVIPVQHYARPPVHQYRFGMMRF